MLVARLCGGRLADLFGRIKTLIIADVVILIAVGMMTFAYSPVFLLVARAILGVGVGLALLVGPTYLSEISPPNFRGRLIALHELCVCLGSLIGFAANLVFPAVSWRAKLGVSAIPSLAQLFLTFVLPESRPPKKSSAADAQADAQKERFPWRATLIAALLCGAGSGCGFYAVQAFGGELLQRFMPEKSMDEISSKILPWFGVAKLLGVGLCYLAIDLMGRKAVMYASMVVVMAAQVLLILATEQKEDATGMMGVIGCGGVIFGWALGIGTMMFLAANELLSDKYRAIGSSIAMVFNSLVEIFYQFTFKSMFDCTAYPSLPFWLFLAYSAFALVLTRFALPETLGVALVH
jgi:MFS family permease